jgi:hypothetical protein
VEEDKKKPGAIWHGFLPDDHPFYTRAGWNFLAAANLPKRAPAISGDEKKEDDGHG